MAKLTAQVKRQIEYALFLAAGQDDPHSVTITELCASLSRLTADNEALRAKLAEAIRALEPFAEEGDEWSDGVPNGYCPGVTEPGYDQAHAKAKFTIGNLRRARRLVEEGNHG